MIVCIISTFASIIVSATISTDPIRTIPQRQQFRTDIGVSLQALRDRQVGRLPRFRNFQAFISSIPNALEECAKNNLFIKAQMDILMDSVTLRESHQAAAYFATYDNFDAVDYLMEKSMLCANQSEVELCDVIISETVRFGRDSILIKLLPGRLSLQPKIVPQILSSAVHFDNPSILKAMVENEFCDTLDLIGDGFSSPLLEAIKKQKPQTLSYMLDQLSELEYNRYRFLKRAILIGNTEIVNIFKNKLGPSAQDILDADLNRAVLLNHVDDVKQLLELGANPHRDGLLSICFYRDGNTCSFDTARMLAHNSTGGHEFYNHFLGTVDKCPPIWPEEHLSNTDFVFLLDSIIRTLRTGRLECLLRIFIQKLPSKTYDNIKNTVIPTFRNNPSMMAFIQFWDGIQTSNISKVMTFATGRTMSFTINGFYPVDIALQMGHLKITQALLRRKAPCLSDDEIGTVHDGLMKLFAELSTMDIVEQNQYLRDLRTLDTEERSAVEHFLTVWNNRH